MDWIILIIGGLFEVGFASCLGKMKETTGTEAILWFIGFLVSLSISMALLMKATQTLPIGTAYAVWTGIGAVGTRSEEHTSELQSRENLVCRLLLEKKKKIK